MKKAKRLLFLLLALPLMLGIGPYRQSSEQTADAAITTAGGYLSGIMVITDGTNSVTVDIYDNATAASGTQLIPQWVIPSSTTSRAATLSFGGVGLKFYNGVYVDVTTSGTVKYMVYWAND
jgi:hypothetical protein